ncbi:hypothetical protein MTO96_003665 [Rhipicephalus appendiculatus]
MLTERHLVTAAHCLKNKTASMLSVNVGDYNLSSSDDAQNIVRNVLSFIQHEEYVIATYDNDIALLTLEEPIPARTHAWVIPGAPLMVQAGNCEAICGIVSFGKKCALKDVYGVYTRVGLFVPWLYANTRDAKCKPYVSDGENYPDLTGVTTKPALPDPVPDNHI